MNQDFQDILSAFCDEGVEFLLVGAYALAVHGLPRATGDLDLWIGTKEENPQRAWRALERFGAPLDQITVEDLSTADTVCQIGVEPLRIDVMTSIDGVEFEVAWSARIETEVAGITLPVISRSHLVQNKRAAGRPQDVADLARLEGKKR